MNLNFWQTPLETFSELMRRKTPHLRQIRHFYSPVLDREVDVDIYLPSDYHMSAASTRYPLLILNDGQDLPRMNFSRILGRMYRKNQIPGIIAVGIYASDQRTREYGVAQQADYKGRGDKAGQYTNFIVEELLPWLGSKFRVTDNHLQRAIAGFSLGGLSALDIGWAKPEIFNTVGVFSGALWWRSQPVDPRDPDAHRIMHELVSNAGVSDIEQYFWFQCGTLDEDEDRNNNGVIDAIDDTLDMIRLLQSKGFSDEYIRYVLLEDGTHDPATWGLAMPDFLMWTFAEN